MKPAQINLWPQRKLGVMNVLNAATANIHLVVDTDDYVEIPSHPPAPQQQVVVLD
jgi:hypothetical protein